MPTTFSLPLFHGQAHLGVKLHLIINDCGELLAVKLTAGNKDDRHPVKVLAMAIKGIYHRLYAMSWMRKTLR